MAFKEKQTSALVYDLFNKADIPVPEEVKQRWEEIEEIYQASAHGIVNVGIQINNCINLIRQVPCSNQNEVIESVNGVTRDLESFTNQLVDLHKLHEGKTGIINDPDDLALCIQIYNQYVAFNDRFKVVIFPIVITITEAYSESQAILQQQNQKDDGITDVEIITEKVKVQ